MKRDSRLSGVLHVLLHLAEASGPVTSEAMAKAMQTNPVVIRRLMAGLREAGFVHSEKGHGGGWAIARDLASVSLRDVYDALGAPELFALGHRTEAPGCLVEQAVNAALDDALRDAETLLLDRFGAVTLAALSVDFHARMVASGKSIDLETVHAG
ncbi:Rrf2 family transcriptional regulator [Qipengyuania qiaonensis]|uniref:Rrf2 family transcriptional regulator n=1 Tax=Qipengyuania qiaonensis TaxID=2867240 RepID=A0ABS7J3Q8_9SPHN|nr:Rrf2 family transcriptional regulator [Qipengyuania qiaonensis]MBX7481961.1 Rrf2 family transcriptional regulator [Qipengyuania qiaonensis]